MSGRVSHTADSLASVIPHHIKREAIFRVQLLHKINDTHTSLDFDIHVFLAHVVHSGHGLRRDEPF